MDDTGLNGEELEGIGNFRVIFVLNQKHPSFWSSRMRNVSGWCRNSAMQGQLLCLS